MRWSASGREQEIQCGGGKWREPAKAPSPRHGEFRATRPSPATADLRPGGRGGLIRPLT